LVLTLPGSVLVAQEEQKATDDWVQPELPESFNAWAVSMGTHFTGANTSLLIKIDRWSTPEEREQILSSRGPGQGASKTEGMRVHPIHVC
jgi:hypothetical protein